MQGENLERWQRACQEAAGEQDPHRFLEVTREIIQMLTEKARRLQPIRTKTNQSELEARMLRGSQGSELGSSGTVPAPN